MGISALATIAMGFSDYGNIKEAYAIDKENKENNKETNYGRQQFKQTLIKMGTLGVSSLLGQAAVETLNTKLHGAKIDLISKKTKKYAKKIAVKTAKKVGGKFLTKIVTKLATKGACKALGAALGTLIPIPGVGTAIGLLIGTAAEWAISKYVLPKFYDDGVQAAEHAKIDNMTEEQALVNICNKLANDVPLLDSEEKLYKKNKMICDNYVIQIKAEAQAAQDNAQANPNDAASVDRTA